MKFLKALIFIFLAIALIFFAMGILKPTIDYGHTVTVNKNAKEAWAVAQDENKHAQWIAGFVSEELISGDKGAVGSKYTVIVKPSPEEDAFEMTETITSRKDFEHIAMHFDSDFGEFDQKMTFVEKDNNISITTESTVKGKNIFMSSMVGWMETIGGSFQKQEEKNINALKKVIDENTTNYYGADSTVAK